MDSITNKLPKAAASMEEAKPAPMVKPGKTKRAAKVKVLVAKPYSPPLASAFADKPTPAHATPKTDKADPTVATPTAPPLRGRKESASGNKVVLIATTCGLVFLLTVGTIFAAWKTSNSARADSGDRIDSKFVAGSPNDPDMKKAPEATDGENEDEIRVKIKKEVKPVLQRKIFLRPANNELDWDPISTRKSTKQPIAGLDQAQINAAIDKGVAYLKRTQNADGSWPSGPGVGYAAIGGLTLLECDVPAEDAAVEKAAAFVRSHIANLSTTYELSLAILFLDRLGEPRDRPLIQGMALRVLAGQTDTGGWSYNCAVLSPQDMHQLYAFLQSHAQSDILNPLGGNPKTQAGIAINPTKDPSKLNDPFQQLHELILTQGIEGTNSRPDREKEAVIAPVDPNPNNPPAVRPKTSKPAVRPIRAETLNPNLRNLPVVKNQGLKKGQIVLHPGGGDNSNTQFAMLALWTARRHDVPTDQALLASFQRFMTSQNGDGGWGYMPGHGSTNSMTNVGLIGLGMGHGAEPDIIQFNPKNPKDIIVRRALQDPAVKKGLTALARHIGQPSADPKKADFPMQNLYFLWSVERVAMLYDLETIDGKDWYGWGAQILVHNQRPDGDWSNSQYPGASPPLNTCFALLFLRRSNLVYDLTDNLRLHAGIRDPEK